MRAHFRTLVAVSTIATTLACGGGSPTSPSPAPTAGPAPAPAPAPAPTPAPAPVTMTMTLRAGPLPSSATQDIERRALQRIRGFLLTAAIQAVNGDVEVSSIRCDGTRGPTTFVVDVWNFPLGTVAAGTTRNFEKPVVIAVDQLAPQDVPMVFLCTALGSPVSGPVTANLTVPGPNVPPVTGGTCTPGPETLCLQRLRFLVKASRTTDSGQTAPAKVDERSRSNESGRFVVPEIPAVDIVAELFDACGLDRTFFAFIDARTPVAVDLTIIDTLTGAQRVYRIPGSAIPQSRTDLLALPCGDGPGPWLP